MLISLQHKFTFFCTPKCASNSIEAMLKPHSEIHLLGSPQVRHTDTRQYAEHVQPYLAEVTRCMNEGGMPMQCLSDSTDAFRMTEAHHEFASEFCDECVLGISGCEDLIFMADSRELISPASACICCLSALSGSPSVEPGADSPRSERNSLTIAATSFSRP